jgi:hypothetical protein
MSSQYAPPPPYGGSTADVSELAQPLAEGTGWIKFLAIMQLIFSGLYVLGSFGIGLLVAWLPIWLAILLLQTATAIQTAHQQNDGEALKQALGKLKLYFVIQAITLIVVFCLSLIAIFAAISMGVNLHNFGHLHQS